MYFNLALLGSGTMFFDLLIDSSHNPIPLELHVSFTVRCQTIFHASHTIQHITQLRWSHFIMVCSQVNGNISYLLAQFVDVPQCLTCFAMTLFARLDGQFFKELHIIWGKHT